MLSQRTVGGQRGSPGPPAPPLVDLCTPHAPGIATLHSLPFSSFDRVRTVVQRAAHGGEQCQERDRVQKERCEWLNECPGEDKLNLLLSQWPVAGPAGDPGARLAPAQEPAEVGGEHMRGLDPAPTRGRILGNIFFTVIS